MSSKSPDSPAVVGKEAIERAARDVELRGAVRREDLWLRINTALVAMLVALVAFFGRDLYSDLKGHTAQLSTISVQLGTLTERIGGGAERVNSLKERVNGIDQKLDKIASDTEQNGRSLAEIKGFLQGMPPSSWKENSPENRYTRH